MLDAFMAKSPPDSLRFSSKDDEACEIDRAGGDTDVAMVDMLAVAPPILGLVGADVVERRA